MDSPTPSRIYAIESSPSEKSTEETAELCRIGLESWFNMEFCHLAGLLQKTSISEQENSLSLRLQFLRESLKDDPSLQVYEQLYAGFLFHDDLDAAYACASAAIGAIWASGRDFGRYDLWLSRTDILLKRIREASPLAVASLLGYKALAELTGQGNLALAVMPYTVQQHWAEKSGSVSLRLLHASTAAFCSFWAGDLTSAELLLTENFPLSKLSSASVLSSLLYTSCLGLCKVVKGDTDAGVSLLEIVIKHKALRLLPLSVYLHVYTNYLYGLCMSGNLVKIQEVADLIMEKTIPPCNYYHLACLHFCLGIAALRLGEPRKALLHSEAAEQRGKMSGSPIIRPLAALIHGQALADLHEHERALKHFSIWLPRWDEKGFGLFAVTGSLEMAAIYLCLGKLETAGRYYRRAGESLPRGERLIALYRDKNFVRQIERSIHTLKAPPVHSAVVDQTPPVSIQTFGSFCLMINGHRVYDRLWKGRRSKQLLKAIISLGGSKVSLEKLSYLLWPDSDGDRGMNSLKTALSRLRRVVDDNQLSGSQWLAVKHRRVSLIQSVCRIDALEFAQAMPGLEVPCSANALERVLSSYQDDFLPNDDAPWIITFRNHLRTLFIEGVLRLASQENSDEDVVRAFLEKACLSAPLHEGVYACLMEHFIKAGYPAHALDIFHRAEKAFSFQTGLHPGPYLQSLALQAKGLSS